MSCWVLKAQELVGGKLKLASLGEGFANFTGVGARVETQAQRVHT